jgi:hypothetical protein
MVHHPTATPACFPMTRRHFFALLPAATLASALASAAPVPDPSAEEIQQLVKISYIRQNMTLKGQLRNDETGAETPMVLAMLEKNISFRFENPPQTINLDLNDQGFILREISKGKNSPVPKSKYTETIRGTDITYEDLSMRFLYWPRPIMLDKETVKHHTCWKLRLDNPDSSGDYAVALIWVNSGSGAIMRMEGYDRQGKLIKRYEVISGMKVGDAWMLKQMRIETFNPTTKKRVGRTYLELEK